MTHAWPGNVRELQNVADRFVQGLTGRGRQRRQRRDVRRPDGVLERMQIQDMLLRHNGNVAEASDASGMPKKTLYHKLRQLKIVVRDAQSEEIDT